VTKSPKVGPLLIFSISLGKSSYLPDELVEDGEEAGPPVRRERDLLVHLEVVQVEGWTRVLPDNIWVWFG
jgi:hypothetical protein